MLFTVKRDFCASSGGGGSTPSAFPTQYAADDADALARGVAVGSFYLASGPVSEARSISDSAFATAQGGVLSPNILGIKEGAVIKNMGFV